MKIVILGGGTGLSNILTGLKNEYKKQIKDLTAIVTVADSGGSSGILKKVYEIPAIGDIRNCLISLSNIESYLKKAMQHRLSRGNGLKGHPLGNLFLVSLIESEGNFLKAIKIASQILKIKGEVMPATLEKIDLKAKFENGKIIKGEHKITEYGIKSKKRIIKIDIIPKNIKAPSEVIKKINNADMIIFSPGSLFTSIIPPCLIKNIKDSINKSKAIRVFIVNLLTQPGETDNFTASDHLKTFIKMTGINKINIAIVNNGKIPLKFRKLIKKEGKELVKDDIDKIKDLNIRVYTGDFINRHGIFVKHSPIKLKNIILKIKKDFNF